MSVREDIVASAVSFLQDPNVISSPIENQLSFLRAKNLTQEEIDAAYARAGATPPPSTQSQQVVHQQRSPPPQQQYYGQYPPQPYGWQPPPPPEPLKRDWRDWFIMATVMGGVSYGLYFLTKRYISPLVTPPTPEKLEQDKETVDEQFEKAFVALEQLAKDTESLKASEQERTERLDKALSELEAFVRDAKSAGRRQDDETERLRDDVRALKSSIPNAMSAHKDFTDSRLKEISVEVRSLKSLIGQRITSSSPTAASTPVATPAMASSTTSSYMRPTVTTPATNGHATTSGVPASEPSAVAAAATDSPTTQTNGDTPTSSTAPSVSTGKQDYISSLGGRSTPFASGAPAAKASIPAWQLAATKSASTTEAGSSS